MRTSNAIGQVLVEFSDVGGAVFVLMLTWATITVRARGSRKSNSNEPDRLSTIEAEQLAPAHNCPCR